jgi:hypothetical protein
MKLARHLGPLLALAVGIPTAIGLATPSGFKRCSFLPGFFPADGPGSALFLAVPTPDTVLAGPGELPQGQGAGHSGNGTRHEIYGQRYRVIGATGQGVAGFGSSPTEVVLVPWDYDASCRPVPWARSARWQVGTDTVLIDAERRPATHWAGGSPTFDVTVVQQAVYSGARGQALGQRRFLRAPLDSTALAARVNSSAELFEFLRRRPSSDALVTGDESVLDAVQAWAIQHDTIARHEPTRSMLAASRARVRAARLFGAPVPMRGTWRLTIRLRSGQELTHWMRTADVPFEPWTSQPDDDWPGPDGYELRYNMALVPDSLPGEYRFGSNWSLTIATRDPTVERAWRFKMELQEFVLGHPEVPELKSLFDEWLTRMGPIWRARNYTEDLTGEIALTPDGGAVLRIGWDSDGDGVDDVVVRGERVSMEVAPHSAASRRFMNW